MRRVSTSLNPILLRSVRSEVIVFLSGSLDGMYGVSESGEMDLLISCLADSRLASSSFLHVPCSVLEVSTVAWFDAMMTEDGLILCSKVEKFEDDE